MVEGQYILPLWIIKLAGISSFVSVFISLTCIVLHLSNYRKPFEQRLIIRIQIILPLFAITCFLTLIHPELAKFVEPIKEIYEAFVIYTFFSLLTDMLGGERNIIISTSGREPVNHPFPMRLILTPVDISDPFSFLNIKRGILQYVWIKPLLCAIITISEILGVYDVNNVSFFSVYVWTGLIYNLSVSLSLYDLAMFWKCLYSDLKPFKPVGKFLCVKLIIFASYWQGVGLAIINWLGYFNNNDLESSSNNAGIAIQNALLCIELIGFAIGHWYSFSYEPFKLSNLPTGKLKFFNSLKDVFGICDLIYDFKLTFYGDLYDYKNFDSVEAIIAHPLSKSRMARINQGLRYYNNGKQKVWLSHASSASQSSNNAHPQKVTAAGKDRTIFKKNSIDSSRDSVRSIYPHSIISKSENVYTQDDLESGYMSFISENDNENNENTENDLSDIDYRVEDFENDERIYREAKKHSDGDKNYPIINDINSYFYSNKIQKLRVEAMARQNYGSIA